ncbi:Gti1/Pac2 family-domain-containing protein [Dichotomocladium elegans]|nr:Gti1/Pac2 family-domain-containing protein [Dichotomocladium elegans]
MIAPHETFHGFVETTTDTLLIFEACRRGILPKINRRLQEKERGAVQPGTVYVFDERESGIKRWTDGYVWSPSRILGNFLIYRELEGRDGSRPTATDTSRAGDHSTQEDSNRNRPDLSTMIDPSRERALVGSLTTSYKFKKGGLIKKTMSIIVNGSTQHLISYYTKEDVLSHRLRTPSSIPELACLDISADLLHRQSFRVPPTQSVAIRPHDHRHEQQQQQQAHGYNPPPSTVMSRTSPYTAMSFPSSLGQRYALSAALPSNYHRFVPLRKEEDDYGLDFMPSPYSFVNHMVSSQATLSPGQDLPAYCAYDEGSIAEPVPSQFAMKQPPSFYMNNTSPGYNYDYQFYHSNSAPPVSPPPQHADHEEQQKQQRSMACLMYPTVTAEMPPVGTLRASPLQPAVYSMPLGPSMAHGDFCASPAVTATTASTEIQYY